MGIISSKLQEENSLSRHILILCISLFLGIEINNAFKIQSTIKKRYLLNINFIVLLKYVYIKKNLVKYVCLYLFLIKSSFICVMHAIMFHKIMLDYIQSMILKYVEL